MNKIYGTDGNAYETSISNGKEYVLLKMNEKEEFVIEELNKIKAEIKELEKEWNFFDDYRKKEGLYYASKIIDNHISELKGENNG